MTSPIEDKTTEPKKTKVLSKMQQLIFDAAPDCPPSFAESVVEALEKAGFKSLDDFELLSNKAAQQAQNAIIAAARGLAARIIQADIETVVVDAPAAFKTRYESEVKARSDDARERGINVAKNLIHLQQIISGAIVAAAALDASALFAAVDKRRKAS